jgi:hypothetical protein
MGPLEFMKSPEPCVMVSFLRSPLCTDQMQSLSRYSWRSPSCHIFLTHLSGMWVTKTWGYFSLTYHLNVTTSSQNHPAEPFLDSWPPPPHQKWETTNDHCCCKALLYVVFVTKQQIKNRGSCS